MLLYIPKKDRNYYHDNIIKSELDLLILMEYKQE
jgi:hypothetical protein